MSNELEVLGNAQVIKDYIDQKLSEIRQKLYDLSRETPNGEVPEQAQSIINRIGSVENYVNGLEDADFSLPSELVVAITEGKSYVKECTEHTLADYGDAVVHLYTVLDIDGNEGYIIIPDANDNNALFVLKGSDTVFHSEMTPYDSVSEDREYGKAYIEGCNFDFNNTADIESFSASRGAFRSAENFYNRMLNNGEFGRLFPEYATVEE